jgi:hypothetical protein
MQVDFTKPLRTQKYKQEVKIYSTNAGGMYPVHGAVYSTALGCFVMEQWGSTGIAQSGPYMDLENVPEVTVIECWAHLYDPKVSSNGIVVHKTAEESKFKAVAPGLIGILHLKFHAVQGEGWKFEIVSDKP